MTAIDQDHSADERFERLLIDSARSDQLPTHVDAAWQKFSVALNGMGLLAAGPSGALAVRRARRWLAAKWLTYGVLAGSALTALSLRPSHDRRVNPSAAPSTTIALSAPSSSAPKAKVEVEAKLQPLPPPLAATKPHSIRPRALPSHSEAAPAPSSTLSAEVALLDAARSAVRAGAFAHALDLADRYRADFPNGELAPEAEVVAIEALVEQGESQPATLRASRFFARYPGDPHTARVKWLVR